MRLSDLKIKSAKAIDKPYKLFDEDGLFLLVTKTGSKLWRWKYRFEKKEKLFSIGSYPSISLGEARDKAAKLKKLLSSGVDPMQQKKQDEFEGILFEDIVKEWIKTRGAAWRPSYRRTQEVRINRYILPKFKDKTVRGITRREILDLIKAIEKTGAHETTHRVTGILTDIFNYAAKLEAIELSPCFGLADLLIPVRSKSLAAITDLKEVGGLMRSIDGYTGSFIVRSALLFSALTFCRPGEIRSAEWEEVDFKKALWTIPANKAKMNKPHLVPLSTQALKVLEELQPLTGHCRFIFPSARSYERPMSEVTVLAALRRMGYGREEMTAHGFRSMASTLLNEQGCKHDVIEAQLAHEGYDKIRAIYNRAEYMDERTQLMQDWANYLDELRDFQS